MQSEDSSILAQSRCRVAAGRGLRGDQTCGGSVQSISHTGLDCTDCSGTCTRGWGPRTRRRGDNSRRGLTRVRPRRVRLGSGYVD